MGFMFTGIIIKNGNNLNDADVLEVFDQQHSYPEDDVSLEKAISSSFEGTAIARVDDMLVLFGPEIGYSCSFEGNELTETDKKLEKLSIQGDVVSFVLNSVASTYAWSLFSNGNRIRVKTIEGKKVLFESDEESKYEKGMTMDEQGVIKLIENFTGYSFIELVFEKKISAAVYNY
jgi:hypothetical protein